MLNERKLQPLDFSRLLQLLAVAGHLAELAKRADDEFAIEMRRHGFDPVRRHNFDLMTFTITESAPVTPPVPSMPPSLAAARRRRRK